MDKNEEILEQTVRYFKEKQDRYGATVKGLDWNSKEAQNIRFQQLEKLAAGEEKAEFSICDYGCGYGDFFVYLQEKGYNLLCKTEVWTKQRSCADTGGDVGSDI